MDPAQRGVGSGAVAGGVTGPVFRFIATPKALDDWNESVPRNLDFNGQDTIVLVSLGSDTSTVRDELLHGVAQSDHEDGWRFVYYEENTGWEEFVQHFNALEHIERYVRARAF